MRRRAPLVVLALAAIAALLALGWLLVPGVREATFGGPRGEGSSDPASLGAGGGAGELSDGGVPGARALLDLDAGLIGTLPPWLPTASVTSAPDCPHGGLSGRVISARDGQGISGVELVFDRDGTTVDTTSGAGGAFALCVSAEGRYVLAIASKEGFLPFAPEWGHSPIALVARAGRRVDGVVVQLVPTSSQRVEVVDAQEAPVAGATVEVLGGGEGERAMAPLAARATTGEDGTATLEAWPGALLEAAHAVHGRGRVRFSGGDDLLRITLGTTPAESASATIRGRVIDAREAPVAGAVVRAFLQRRGLHPSAQAASDDEGFFVLDGLDEGPHYLAATHPSHPRTELYGVPTGSQDVVLRVEAGAVLEGQVIDEGGAPVPAFNVVARLAQGALVRRTVATVASYDADGHFRLAGLVPGDYELVATSRGYPPSPPVAVTTTEAGAPRVTLRLSRGGRVEGRVTGAEGAPVAGARVSLESVLARSGSGSAAPSVLASVTDAEGGFVLEGIGGEVASLRVQADGHHERMVSGMRAAPGATVELEVALTPLREGESPRLELAGIGVTLFPRDDQVFIGTVVEGGTAQEAGLRPGDRVIAVDGAPVTQIGFEATLDRIRGTEGTTVRLTLQRSGEDAPTQLALVRRRVRA